MKKLCAFLLVAAMLLCAATAFAAVEPLRLTWWGSESSNALYLSVSDMFQEATGIEYEAEYLSWDDYWTKLNTLAAANDLDFEKAARLRDQMLALKGEKTMSSGEKSRQARRKRGRQGYSAQ